MTRPKVHSEAVVLSGSTDRTVRMWNAMTGSLVCTFVLDRVPVTALAALTTGGDDPRTLVCAGTAGGTVYVWESEQEAVGGVPLSAQESGGSGGSKARRNTVPKGALVSMMDHTETRVTCLAAISGGSGVGGASRAGEDDEEAGASGPAFTIFAATDDGVLRGE